MSVVSARLSLIHLTTVQRDANAATDDGWGGGNPDSHDWQDHLTDLPCRYWVTVGRERTDATTEVVVEDMRLIVELGTDVTGRDRLGGITYRGDTIAAGPIGIRAVLQQKDHLELVLVRLS